MRPDARLHADEARQHVGEPSVDLAARQLLAQGDGADLVEADEVERVPMSMPIVATASRLVVLRGMGCSWCWQPRASFVAGQGRNTAGPSH